MKNLARNLLGVFLLVGIFAACSSSEPYVEQAQVNIYTQNFDSAYAILDRQIEATPSNGVPYYYKALANSEEAKTISDPNSRKPVYRDFRENAVTSRELFAEMEETPSEAGQVNNLILSTWGREHNAALEYATNDSVMATVDQPLKLAVAHLENAVIINPDSTLSFEVLGQVQLMDDNYEGAAVALRDAIELKDPPLAEDYDRLASIYVNLENYDESIILLQEGLEMYPDSVYLTQKLADIYMQTGERDKSIGLLEDLLESDPENAQYHLALGTQILQATTELSNDVSAKYDEIYDLRDQRRNASASERENINNQITQLEQDIATISQEIEELAEDAEAELKTVVELRPEDETALNALGILYQNRAAALFEQRNYTDDNDLANQYDAQAKEDLTTSMDYYEQVVEINPENTGAWRSLAQIYTTLGMNEKASEAMDKAGM